MTGTVSVLFTSSAAHSARLCQSSAGVPEETRVPLEGAEGTAARAAHRQTAETSSVTNTPRASPGPSPLEASWGPKTSFGQWATGGSDLGGNGKSLCLSFQFFLPLKARPEIAEPQEPSSSADITLSWKVTRLARDFVRTGSR